jgi:hypothetical protein
MLRIAIRLWTIVALLAALAVAVWWWINPGQDWLQAPSTALALIAAVCGIPADRWAVEAQRRSRALTSLRQELDQNAAILDDPRFRPEAQGIGQVYPRLMLGAVDTAFISGALTWRRDRDLLRRLLEWRNAADDLNRRLDITELRLCIVDRLDGDELSTLRNIMREPDGYFALVARRMHELRTAVDAASGRRQYLPVKLSPVRRRLSRPAVRDG